MARKKAASGVARKKKARFGDLNHDGKVDLKDAKVAVERLGSKITAVTQTSARATSTAVAKAGRATERAGRAVKTKAVDMAKVLGRGTRVVGTTLFDLNNDGRVDEEDLKIAAQRSATLAKQVADELASSETAKGAAKAAAVLAIIAIPVPLIGPAGGAAVGAGGYLVIKATKEVAEAIGTALHGHPTDAVQPKSRRRTTRL